MLVWLLIFGAMNMSHLVRTPIYGLIIVLTVGFSVLTSPLQARVQLDIIAKFRNADVELDVVTVVDSEVEASKSKVALLGIATPLRSSFSFRLVEWLLLIDLWSKAVKAQSDSWRVIGSMTETETSDVSHLTIKCWARGQVCHQFGVHPLGWTGGEGENRLTEPGFRGESPWPSSARIRSSSSARSSKNFWVGSHCTPSPGATGSAAI